MIRIRIFPLLLAVCALCSSPLFGEDLFEEASGGQWEISKKASYWSVRWQAGVSIYHHRQPANERAVLVVSVGVGGEAMAPRKFAMKVDGSLHILECKGQDIDSHYDDTRKETRFRTRAACLMPWEVSSALLAAEAVEVQILTSEGKLPVKTLKKRQLASLKSF